MFRAPFCIASSGICLAFVLLLFLASFDQVVPLKMILNRGGMRVSVHLHKDKIDAILEQFKDLSKPYHVSGILAKIGMESKRCENCMKDLLIEAIKMNQNEESNNFFPY